MKVDEPCENALIKATLDNFKVKGAVRQIDEAQARFFEKTQEVMEGNILEGSMPSPSTIPLWSLGEWDEVAEAAARAAKGEAPPPPKTPKPKSGEGGKKGPPYNKDPEADLNTNKFVHALFNSNAWQSFKQMRVSMMLANLMTLAKNAVTTGGQAGMAAGEERLALLFSKRHGALAQDPREWVAYRAGIQQAAQDIPHLLTTLGKMTFQKGALAAEDMKSALRQMGYAEDLAVHSKADLIQKDMGRAFDKFENLPALGARFLNGAFGSQISAMSATDMAFKLISYRSKARQLLTRKAIQAGHTSDEAIDLFVGKNWEEMVAANKAGTKLSGELADIQASSVKKAAQDTYTEVPQTDLGKFIAGNYDTASGWKRTVSEIMQVIAPFRSIYVNLMRQGITRRLVPFFDKQTMTELFPQKYGIAMTPEVRAAQDLAYARLAAGWTVFVSTGVLIHQGAIKLHTSDSVDPAVRQMQFEFDGKIGGTFQIGDWYYPVDMLPPSIAIPLAWSSAALQGIDEAVNFRYTADDEVENAVMRGLKPFMTGVTDGPWVREYLDFLARTNSYLQHGDMAGFTGYLAQITLSPMKPPRWMHGMLGVDRDVKTTDGWVGTIAKDWWDWESQYGYRRNMAGMRITPPMRYGRNLDKPYFGMSDEVTSFLNAADYDKVYPKNITKAVGDEALARKLGIDDRALRADMPPQAVDRFEYYIGQSRALNGMTFEEQLKMMLRSQRIFDKDGAIREGIGKPRVQRAILKVHSERRKMARELVKYNPAFGIRQKQIDSAYKAYRKQFPSQPRQAEQLREQLTREMNMKVQQYRNAF